MKKLNSKGFTLIELLAVIVVLAIVMVIATTSILNSTGSAAGNSFVQSARTIADFVSKQNQLLAADANGSSNEDCYITWANSQTTIPDRELNSYFDASNADEDAAKCFGINTKDYSVDTSTVSIDNGKVTVKLCPNANGRFKNITGNFDGITVEEGHCVTVTK